VPYHPEITCQESERLYPEHRYPASQLSPKGALIVTTTVLFLLPILITLLCDLQFNGGITWSGYVSGALAVMYVPLMLPWWFRRRNPVIFVPCTFVAMGLYLLYVSIITEGGWFLSFAFPVVGTVGIIVTAVTTLLRYLTRGRLYIFGGAFIAIGGFFPVMELLMDHTFQVEDFLGWSFYPLAALVLLGGMLIFLAIYAPARETMERKFFL
jgi:hypothetical protein